MERKSMILAVCLALFFGFAVGWVMCALFSGSLD